MRPPAWAQKVVTRVTGQASDVARDMVWLQRIPRGASPADKSSLFGTHIALNKTQCPLTYLARLAGPDTVRFDHGIMSGSVPDAVYTRDPVLTRRVLQNKANPKTKAWYRFHQRMFDYRLPPEVITYSNADDPKVIAIRKAYAAGLGEMLARRENDIVTHIQRWTDAARGSVEMVRAVRSLMAELSYLIGFGELPTNPLWVMTYRHTDSLIRDPKRRLAHLLWPILDRLPTPYGVMHRSRAAVFRWMSAYYFKKHWQSTDSLLAWFRHAGETNGTPEHVWEALPFVHSAINGILPFPMIMTLCALGEQRDVQDRIVREGLYTAAVKEGLRLYPGVTTIGRIVTEHVNSESAVLEPMASPAAQFYMNPTAVLRHPRGWSRPNEYVLDRWLPGWSDDTDAPYRLYIPFGLGARSCVGAAFATKLLETFMQIVLSRRVISNPSGQQPRVAEGSVKLVRRPFMLHFADRSPDSSAASRS